MTEKLTVYEPAAALINDEEIAFFMADALETGDSACIAKALDVVCRPSAKTAVAVREAQEIMKNRTARFDAID